MFHKINDYQLYYISEAFSYWTICNELDDGSYNGIIGGLALSEVYWKAKDKNAIPPAFHQCVTEYIESCDKLDYEPEEPMAYEGV